MPRRLKGIRRRRDGWQAYVRVAGVLYTKQFPIDHELAKMREWREQQIDLHGGRHAKGGTLLADVAAFLLKPEIAAQPYVSQTAAHLGLWVAELDGHRPRASITRDEIESVLQRWLKRYAEATVYHRRTALMSLWVTLDGPDAANPVRGTTCPKAWTPRDQSVPFEILAKIVAAMPDFKFIKKGVRRPSTAKLVSAVLLHTGWRGVDFLEVRRPHVNWQLATVKMPGSDKGRGSPPWTAYVTDDGLKALKAFDAANLYGAFSEAAVSHSFKRAARQVDGPHTPIHLYSLRHSVGADQYRTSKDLGIVGRTLGHVPGSKATAQYALGANADVDRAAAAALGAARQVQRSAIKLPKKLPASRKRKQTAALRRRA